MRIEERPVPNIGCDVCGRKAVRWFDNTSVVLCDSDACYQVHRQYFDEHLKEMSEEHHD